MPVPRRAQGHDFAVGTTAGLGYAVGDHDAVFYFTQPTAGFGHTRPSMSRASAMARRMVVRPNSVASCFISGIFRLTYGAA